MAEGGKAWPFLDGECNIYGMFVIEGISQSKSLFLLMVHHVRLNLPLN